MAVRSRLGGIACLVAAMGTAAALGAPTAPCNGAVDYCDRLYDQLAIVVTHNAMSNRAEGWSFPNQNDDIPTQLAAGVRGLMLDVWYWAPLGGTEKPTLCHGGGAACYLGNKDLVEGLGQIEAFLASHPREVLTIIFESYISAADMAAAFEQAGLIPYLYTKPATGPWPTLGQMIEAGTRLVVFTDNGGGDPAWYHPVWDHAWETDYAATSPDDFSCEINRGSPGNDLFILNHFLTAPLASEDLARQVNFNPFFRDRALQCMSEAHQLPNFVTVDFYDVGDVFAVVDDLNRQPIPVTLGRSGRVAALLALGLLLAGGGPGRSGS